MFTWQVAPVLYTEVILAFYPEVALAETVYTELQFERL